MSELVLLFSADADIQQAFEFYDTWQSGRGEVFLRYLDAAFTRLLAFPQSGPVFHQSYRRFLIQGFPYGIFYVVEGKRVVIAGILDLRQNPSVIRRRLRG